MKSLNIDLGERSYPVIIGENLMGSADFLLPYISGQSVLVVTNETVAPLYLPALREKLDPLFSCESLVLPDGEVYKTLDTIKLFYDKLLQHRFSRSSTIIALGGGVVGDMAGFAAATYQRGVNFIQIPTTLLSQVDSSVGGKTGVNHPLGKNMIGAFYQPKCVLIDTLTLTTLPKREFSAGMAEVIKYGLISEPDFFSWIEQSVDALLHLDSAALDYAIMHSCDTKARIVSLDERESGVRALLNLGHTFGHAIETSQGYGVILHGEAVAIGTVIAARLSNLLGWLTANDVERIVNLFRCLELPVSIPASMSIDAFFQHMAVDKKVLNGKLRLVLLKKIGEACIVSDVSQDAISTALEASYS